MGIFDLFAKKTNSAITAITDHTAATLNHEEDREIAITTLKKILHALHDKNFQEVILLVDESEIEDLADFLIQYVQATLEENGFDAVDEYGVECSFHPSYEYSQLSIDEYNDKSGFYLEYDLSSGGDLVDMTLQLKFTYSPNGLKRVFQNIDPQ